MSRWEKLLERIRNNPKTVTFEEVDKILCRLGYERRQPSGARAITLTGIKGSRR